MLALSITWHLTNNLASKIQFVAKSVANNLAKTLQQVITRYTPPRPAYRVVVLVHPRHGHMLIIIRDIWHNTHKCFPLSTNQDKEQCSLGW